MHTDFSNVLYKTGVTGRHMWDMWWESSNGMGLFSCNFHLSFSLIILQLLLTNVHLFIYFSSQYIAICPRTFSSRI